MWGPPSQLGQVLGPTVGCRSALEWAAGRTTPKGSAMSWWSRQSVGWAASRVSPKSTLPRASATGLVLLVPSLSSSRSGGSALAS